MRLHVVYRSTGGENPKARPAYYSKLGSLRSLLRNVGTQREARGELAFLDDGPVPDDRLEAIMASAGTVVETAAPRAAGRLYRRAIEEPQRRGWPDEDLVYLAEDDYLYRREALPALAAAAHELPAVRVRQRSPAPSAECARGTTRGWTACACGCRPSHARRSRPAGPAG